MSNCIGHMQACGIRARRESQQRWRRDIMSQEGDFCSRVFPFLSSPNGDIPTAELFFTAQAGPVTERFHVFYHDTPVFSCTRQIWILNCCLMLFYEFGPPRTPS